MLVVMPYLFESLYNANKAQGPRVTPLARTPPSPPCCYCTPVSPCIDNTNTPLFPRLIGNTLGSFLSPSNGHFIQWKLPNSHLHAATQRERKWKYLFNVCRIIYPCCFGYPEGHCRQYHKHCPSVHLGYFEKCLY